MRRHRPPASDIAGQFVQQYFEHLHKQPSTLHNFYNEDSVFSRLAVEEKCCASSEVKGQQNIKATIASLGYQDCKVVIDTVDSQTGVGGGVIVTVTGILLHQKYPSRQFVQTFFLQEDPSSDPPRYYVRNDFLRYLKPLNPPEDRSRVLEHSSNYHAPQMINSSRVSVLPIAETREVVNPGTKNWPNMLFKQPGNVAATAFPPASCSLNSISQSSTLLQSNQAQPSQSQPSQSQPSQSQPSQSQPSQSQPSQSQPSQSQPSQSQPNQSQPISVRPISSQSIPLQSSSPQPLPPQQRPPQPRPPQPRPPQPHPPQSRPPQPRPPQQSPPQQTPPQQTPPQQTLPQQTRPQQTLPQRPPQQIPAKQIPAKQIPAKQIPAKQIPAKQIPVKQSPPQQRPPQQRPPQQSQPLPNQTQPKPHPKVITGTRGWGNVANVNGTKANVASTSSIGGVVLPIYVNALPQQVSEADIKKLFGVHGKIRLIQKPPNKGYCFIHFDTQVGVENAIKSYKENGIFLGNQKLYVDRRKPRPRPKSQHQNVSRGGARPTRTDVSRKAVSNASASATIVASTEISARVPSKVEVKVKETKEATKQKKVNTSSTKVKSLIHDEDGFTEVKRRINRKNRPRGNRNRM